MTVGDIDLFEINEAFAAVPLKVIRDLKIPHEKANVNGGAIALGHPLGATGAMLIGTVIDELERRDLTTGLVTMCIGERHGNHDDPRENLNLTKKAGTCSARSASLCSGSSRDSTGTLSGSVPPGAAVRATVAG